MSTSQKHITLWVFVWTLTLMAWAMWGYWSPHIGSLTEPAYYQKSTFEHVSYNAEPFRLTFECLNREDFLQSLRSGRPIDLYVLSTLKMGPSDVDRLTDASIKKLIVRLLDDPTLSKYNDTPSDLGSDVIASPSRLERFEQRPSLSGHARQRMNANLLTSFYPIEFEFYPPDPVRIVEGPLQELGFLNLKLRFKTQREPTPDLKMKYMTRRDPTPGVLFQTAKANQGIRLEIARSLADTVVLRAVIGNNGAANELVLSADVDVYRPHSVELSYSPSGNLSAIFDGTSIGSIENQNPMLDTMMIGNGFNGSKPFWGSIDVDRVDVSVLHRSVPRNAQHPLMAWFGLLLAIGNTLAFYHILMFLLY